jgi:hypothetical protein
MYSGNPALLHRRLRELSDSQNTKLNPIEQPFTSTPSLAANSPAAWQFGERVASCLEDGLLRYSRRVALLKEAERLGIKRFEANLIIAVAQHRHRPAQPVAFRTLRPASSIWQWLAPVTLAFILQMAFLGFLYCALMA